MKKISAVLVFCVSCVFPAIILAGNYDGGSGTPGDPYLISTPEQMNAIGSDPNDWDKNFRLAANIDMVAYDGDAGGNYNIIGKEGVADFTGTFDGDNYTISNLYYYSSLGNAGIFDRLVGATVSNLNLAFIRIVMGQNCGGIASYVENSTISNCYVSGRIAGDTKTGGLAGHVKSGLITRCKASVQVIGLTDLAGGLVGYNESGTIEKSKTTSFYDTDDFGFGYIVGSVIIDNSPDPPYGHMGGLVGKNGGTIRDCYTEIESVSGNTESGAGKGGLVGVNEGVIMRCYSNAFCYGNGVIGGLVGIDNGGVVLNSLWDEDTTGITTSAGGTGKTTGEMFAKSTFTNAGWDFVGESINGTNDIWIILEGEDYPRFAEAVFYGTGSGTEFDPYLISTPEQFNSIGRTGSTDGKYFSLTSDMNFALYPDDSLMLAGVDGPVFMGVFDGNGHTIYDYDYTPISSHQGVGGLFGYTNEAEIRNLNMHNVHIETDSVAFAGSFVASGSNTKIINCNASGLVSCPFEAGGIVGQLYSTTSKITDCRSNCTVSGNLDAGGIAGYSYGVITNSYLQGGVVYGGGNVGGIAGLSNGSITGCNSTGDVYSSGSSSGGIAGQNNGIITTCWSNCLVTGEENTGGLVGSSTGDILSSYASGDVTGFGSKAGGLVGHSVNGIVSMSSAKGNVSATGSYGGGLVGLKDAGDIIQCYATGNVSSMETGGLVGRMGSAANVINSFAHGHVNNTDVSGNAGGLVGYISGGTIFGSYSSGIVSGIANFMGGLVGGGLAHFVSESYWDLEISQQALTSGGGVGLSTKDMKKQLSYLGWDFDGVWRIEEDLYYPLHREFPVGDLNFDRKVNLLDLQILANNWLAGTQ